MTHFFNIFLSNQTENLFLDLKNHLFSNTHPFSKRLVIVPSTAMKSWLQLEMAKDPELSISMGIEVGFIDPTIHHLAALLNLDKTIGNEPTELALAFAIEKTILDKISQFHHLPHEIQEIWKELFDYLTLEPRTKVHATNGTTDKLPNRIRRRITTLASTLTQHFINYGKYGGKVIEEWKNSKLTPNWQHLLWNEIENLYSPWLYPYLKLENVTIDTNWNPRDLQIHLFGFSHLVPLYHRFLLKISHTIPVFYYIFSPCQHFWSDLLTDKESMRLQHFWQKKNISEHQKTSLEEILQDNNPLLANFGRMGREMAEQIEAIDSPINENYIVPASILTEPAYINLISPDLIPQHSTSPLTILEALQTDITLLRNPLKTEKISFPHFDGSIQVHAAPKPMREVQAIYDVILSILDRHAHENTPITPADVVVMAPNLSSYIPYIQAVFESNESLLNIHISDIQTPTQFPLIQGFLHLINLPLSRWDSISILRLFEYSAFQMRHGITPQDVETITDWFKAADIRWGKDAAHRNEILKRDHCEQGMVEESWHGTWEYGLGRLLEGIAMINQDDVHHHFSPLNLVETHQGELLGKIIHLLNSLSTDLKPLTNQSSLTLTEWTSYLKCLFDTYFICDHDLSETQDLLYQHLEAFGKASTQLENISFPFYSIRHHLEKSLQSQISSSSDLNLQTVRFCSLLPMRTIPAKVIVLMGMNDGVFPTPHSSSSLNLLATDSKSDYIPSQTDFDRYLFLEALLSARRYFIASYTSQAPGDSQSQLPSLLIKELLSYLDQAFHLPNDTLPSHQCFHLHPFTPFHHSYFSSNSLLNNYSNKHYQAALSHYQPEKQPPKNFLSSFTTQDPLTSAQHNAGTTVINLSDLTAFIRNPLKVYCNKVLSIYVNPEANLKETEEEFLVSSIDRAHLIKTASLSCTTTTLSLAEKQGKLPKGPFKELEEERLLQDINLIKTHLTSLDIHPHEFFSIEFNDRYQSPDLTGPNWLLPPLSLIDSSLGHLSLIGQLDLITPKGMVLFAEDELEESIKAWPKLLALATLINAYQLPITPQVIFVKGNKNSCRKLDFAQPEPLLMHLLEYYVKHHRHLSPLLPDWIAPILNGTTEKLKKSFESIDEDEFNPIYNDYLKWIVKNSPDVDLNSMVSQWQITTQQLYLDMANAWYSK